MSKNLFCLIKTCTLISKNLFCSVEPVTFSAGSQRSILVKHGFNQTNIALISVEKLQKFQLKWVIYMPKNIFCLIKTCALISKNLFCSVELVTFSPVVNAQCTLNADYCSHAREWAANS